MKSSPSTAPICGVIGACGPSGEPLACGYEAEHGGDHSWASLPTFFNGRTILERLAIEFVKAESAWADVAAESGRMSDPKRAEDERRLEARTDLFQAVRDVN